MKSVFVTYCVIAGHLVLVEEVSAQEPTALFDFSNELNRSLETQYDVEIASNEKGDILLEEGADFDTPVDFLSPDIWAAYGDIISVGTFNPEVLSRYQLGMTQLGNEEFQWSIEQVKNYVGYQGNQHFNIELADGGVMALLVDEDNIATGFANIEGSQYRIRYLADNYYAFISEEAADGDLRNDENDVLLDDVSQDNGLNCQALDNPDVDLQVVVAYTSRAKEMAHSKKKEAIKGLVNQAEMLTNFTLSASEVQAQIEVLDVKEIPYSETYDFSRDINNLLEGRNGLEDVKQWRKDHKADIVVLVVHHGDPGECGLAGQVNATVDTSMVVVNWQCMNTKFSYAHEIGHLLGARHDNDPNNPAHAHGYLDRLNEDTPIGTVMAAQRSCRSANQCWRIWHWSNPDVDFRSVATGKPGKNNNACEWRRNARKVAAFGDSL